MEKEKRERKAVETESELLHPQRRKKMDVTTPNLESNKNFIFSFMIFQKTKAYRKD